jgi:hypothetical protein
VSLILDALRKLEREKEAPRRGFQVMTHVPWSRQGSGTRLLTAAVVGLSVAVGVLGFALWRRTVQAPVPVALSPLTAPAESAPPAALSEPAPAAAVPTPRPSTAIAAVSPPPARRAIARPAVAAGVDPGPPVAPPKPPGPTPAPKKGELHLNAISRQDGQPVALPNDRLVREGDVFDGVRVIHIGESSVEVEVDGRRKTVGF